MGANADGQLGVGSTIDSTSLVEAVGMGADNVAVAGGHAHVLFLKADGTIYGTGKNDDGQLGDGSQSVRLAPVQLTLLGSDNSSQGLG